MVWLDSRKLQVVSTAILACFFDGISVNPAADCRKGQRMNIIFNGQLQAVLVTSGQKRFVLRFSAVNRSHRVNDMTGGKIVPVGNSGFAGRTSTQGPAFFQKFRDRRPDEWRRQHRRHPKAMNWPH